MQRWLPMVALYGLAAVLPWLLAPLLRLVLWTTPTVTPQPVDAALADRLAALTTENLSLRRQLAAHQDFVTAGLDEWQRVPTRILRRSRRVGHELVIVDRGTVHGIRNGMAAVDGTTWSEPLLPSNQMPPGQVAERLKAHAWKACNGGWGRLVRGFESPNRMRIGDAVASSSHFCALGPGWWVVLVQPVNSGRGRCQFCRFSCRKYWQAVRLDLPISSVLQDRGTGRKVDGYLFFLRVFRKLSLIQRRFELGWLLN